METSVSISYSVYKKNGTLNITGMKVRDKHLFVEMLLDTFCVDDAYYSSHDGLVHVQNWHTDIDVEELKRCAGNTVNEMFW